MTKLRKLVWAFLLACCLVTPASASRFIIDLVPGADITQICAKYGLTVVSLISAKNGVYLVSAPDPTPPSLLQAIDADPAVDVRDSDDERAEPSTPPAPPVDPVAFVAALQDHSTVPYFGATVRTIYAQQPGAVLIHVPDVLATLASGGGIVAVIDTGVDTNHPALQNVLVPGYDFTRNTPGGSELADLNQSTVAILDQSTVAILDSKNFPMLLNQSTVAILDQSTVAILDATQLPSAFGHGTMVAGLIHLVAPTARIMPLKAFHADGSADVADIVRAIYYAVDNNAKVINMSFSSLTRSPALTAAVKYAYNHNVVCVASAGNYGKQQVVYPAADYGVIGVGSTTALDQRSVFSDYGTAAAQMGAPGEALITTYPGNNYAAVWGTSFSSALVSGGAALLAQVAPQISASGADKALDHGRPLENTGLGNTRLDVLAMITYFLNPRD